ncbi:hypothetical protein V6Z12_D01G106200 [Gossypium hirsutum]
MRKGRFLDFWLPDPKRASFFIKNDEPRPPTTVQNEAKRYGSRRGGGGARARCGGSKLGFHICFLKILWARVRF